MFKFNHNHRLSKFITVSASALMLLSVGGGALGAAHSNVHADGITSLFSKFDSQSQSELINAYLSGQISRQELEQGKQEYAAHPEAFDALAKEYHYHIDPNTLGYYINNPAAAQQLLTNAENGQKAQKPSQQVIKKNANKQAKKGHKRVNKKVVKNLKKHLRKTRRTRKSRVIKNSLVKRMNSLKRQLRTLKGQIKKLSARKFRSRRGKRYAKRRLAKLNRQYNADTTKLNGLNKQYRAMSKKAHKVTPRKQNKHMNKKNRRQTKRNNKKQGRRNVKKSARK